MARSKRLKAFCLILCFLLFFSCATTNKSLNEKLDEPDNTGLKSNQSKFIEVPDYPKYSDNKKAKVVEGSPKSEVISKKETPEVTGTILPLPSKEELQNKKIDKELLENVNKASPLSLKTAVLYINNDPNGLTDENKTYLKIIEDIMYLVYPLEIKGSKPPIYNDENDLVEGLQAVKNKSYPITMKRDSFLSLIIPSLILTFENINLSTIQNYREDMNERILAAIEMEPNSVLPYYLLGCLKEKTENYYEAVSFYKKAWEIDNSCYPAGLRYAELIADMGKGDETVKIAILLEKFYPENFLVKNLYAKGYIAMGDYDKASLYIINMLRKEPDNLPALLLRIRVLIEQKEYLKANSLLDAYSTKSKMARDYLLFRARISKEWSKNLIAAIGFLTEAYQLYPENFSVLLACAEICFDTSQTIEDHSADFFIGKVLEKNPENLLALSLLVKNHINNEKWNKAIVLAKELNSKHSNILNKELLIQAYLGSSRYSEALNLAEKLYLSTDEPKNSLFQLYADSLFYSGNYKKLNRLINEKISDANSDLKSIFFYYRAKMVKKSNTEEYLSALRSSLLSNPRNKYALFAMYEWYFGIKDYRKAKYYLGQVIAIEPQNKKMIKLSKKLDELLADK